MKNIHAIILAAGKGTRMHSSTAKVLQVLSDKTLLSHVLNQAKNISQKIHIIYGFGGQQVQQSINDNSINWVEQIEQLGTGHAVAQAMPHIEDNSISLILYGDVPLIKQKTLKQLIDTADTTGVALLSVVLNNPTGYGRIIRKNNIIQAIVEQKDANKEQLNICEVNTGIMAINTQLLKKYLNNLNSDNAQGELYLTDIIAMAVNDNKIINSIITQDEFEVAGVNDKAQLAKLERIYQQRKDVKYMQQGLTLKDPNRFDCRGNLSFGTDCEIDINNLIEGEVSLGNNTLIVA
jgi:bifunctional UDP-N-acetylglucosamine pyrophosphorylase/glucosamine-1-phosphate N-acetyltransferase